MEVEGPPRNPYDASLRSAAAAEIAAMTDDHDASQVALSESINHSLAIGWPSLGWAQIVTSAATSLPAPPPDIIGAVPSDGLPYLTERVRTGSDTQALDAIGEMLGLSRRTVSNHLSRLYSVTGLSGREELSSVIQPLHIWRPQETEQRF